MKVENYIFAPKRIGKCDDKSKFGSGWHIQNSSQEINKPVNRYRLSVDYLQLWIFWDSSRLTTGYFYSSQSALRSIGEFKEFWTLLRNAKVQEYVPHSRGITKILKH